MSLIKSLSTKQKVELLKELYHDIAGKGQDGDTMLAHINPEEALLLKMYGGSGTINPYTGLPEYKKAVKTIAKVAAVAAVSYASFKTFGAASALKAGPVSKYAAAIHTAGASAGKGFGASLFSAATLQKAGLGLQTVGYLQQRKAISAQSSALKSQAEEQRKVNEMQERYRLVQERRQRLDVLRQARIQTGGMEAQMGQAGLGLTGTSGFTGATSSIQTQATANLGAINMASGASTAISEGSQRAADFGTQANIAYGQQQQWANISKLGSFMADNNEQIINIFKV